MLKQKRMINALLHLPTTKITDYDHLCVVDDNWIIQVSGNVITKYALDTMTAEDMSKQLHVSILLKQLVVYKEWDSKVHLVHGKKKFSSVVQAAQRMLSNLNTDSDPYGYEEEPLVMILSEMLNVAPDDLMDDIRNLLYSLQDTQSIESSVV